MLKYYFSSSKETFLDPTAFQEGGGVHTTIVNNLWIQRNGLRDETRRNTRTNPKSETNRREDSATERAQSSASSGSSE